MANKKTVERLQRTIEEREKEILEARSDLADCQKAYQAVVDGKQTIAKALANDRDAEIKRQKELLDSRLIDLGKANQRIAEMELAYDLIRTVAVKVLPLEERVRAFEEALLKFCQTCHKLCRDCPIAEVRDVPTSGEVQEVLRTHAISLKMTIREACRQRVPLDGAEAQAIEHALTCAERETLTLRNIVQDYRTNWDAHDKDLMTLIAKNKGLDDENAVLRKGLRASTEKRESLETHLDELKPLVARLVREPEKDYLNAEAQLLLEFIRDVPPSSSPQEKPTDNPVKLRKQSLEGMSGPETTRPDEYNIECPHCHDQMLDGKCTACGLTVTENIVIDDSCCGCHDKLHARVLTNSGWMCIPCFRRIINCME